MARQGHDMRVSKAGGWALVGLAIVGLLASAVAQPGALAQDKKGTESPVGGPAWNAKVSPEPTVAGVTLDAQQMDVIKRVNEYFSGLDNLKGAFLQTTSDNKRLRGKFYLKKPGKARFEYSLPSKQLIISDGQQIAIQDLDISTDDRISLDQTPFRILLRKDVDLVRDAHILEVQESPDLLIVALQDKSKDSPGRVRLFLAKTPVIDLKEWVTTDAQGVDTRLEVSALDRTQPVDAALFKITSPTLNKPQ